MGMAGQPAPPPPPSSLDYFQEMTAQRRFVMFVTQLVAEAVAVELVEPLRSIGVHVPVALVQPEHIKQTLRRAKIDFALPAYDSYTHMENVLNIMNNMDLAIQAVEQEKDGIKKLFDRLWEEQEHP